MSSGGLLLSAANELSGSSLNNRIQEPHILNFPRWDGQGRYRPYFQAYFQQPSPPRGSTAKWYRNQPTTAFSSIQHRKERAGPFFHEFVVVLLNNNTVCRFDRRGDPNTRANAFTNEGMVAQDTAHVIQKHESHYHEIHNTSDLLLQITFSDSRSLITIMRACCGIQQWETTRPYSLLKHNCYFFSWVILCAFGNFDGPCFSSWVFKSFQTNQTFIEWRKQGKLSLWNRVMAKVPAAFRTPITGRAWRPPRQPPLMLTFEPHVSLTEKLLEIMTELNSRVLATDPSR